MIGGVEGRGSGVEERGKHNIAFNPNDLQQNSCLDGLCEGMIKAWELWTTWVGIMGGGGGA